MVENPKAAVMFGPKQDTKIYRKKDGDKARLQLSADLIDLSASAVTVNGKAIGAVSMKQVEALVAQALKKRTKHSAGRPPRQLSIPSVGGARLVLARPKR